MAKRRKFKKDVWFQRAGPFGFTPVNGKGLILSLVVAPLAVVLLLSPNWLDKLGSDPWVEALCFAIGAVAILVCIVLFITRCEFDPEW